MVIRFIRTYLTPASFIAASAIVIAGWSLTGQAALLNLATAPLYMGTNSQPNIMLIIDDSGSMDWESITQDASQDGRFTGTQPDGTSPSGSGSVKHRDDNNNGTADCTFSSGTFYGYIYGVDSPYNTYSNSTYHCNTADDQEWRYRNAQFNTLYFDPNRTYTPWFGLDSGGTAFANMPVTAARLDPYNPSSVTIDLTTRSSRYNGSSGYGTADRDGDGQPDGFRYYTWTDADGDGLFDNGEETQFLIKNASAAVKQNFANWFSYYRSRELVAKAAYGRIIAEAKNVRMGLSTLNNNNSVKRAIAVMNDDPATGNKRVLMDALYSINSTSGTPLQTALNECGKYLSCTTNTLFSSCPALSAALGGNCQQNYAIVMTDGFYNGTAPSVGNTDGDNNTAFDGGAFADSYSNTLGDIAMKYYENDIQPGLANDVAIVPGFDEARHQHMSTYTVSFGQRGTLTSNPPDYTSAFAWPNPGAGDAQKIDDLRHAAFNGRGLYLSANDPDALVTALQEAVADIMAHTSAASALAFNTTNLSAGATVYQARFESLSWTGQLRYLPISSTGVIGAQTLDAADLLDTAVPSNRVIITRNSSTGVGVPFRWASLASAQQTSLNANSGGTNDSKGSLRVDYLRGVRTGEASNGGTFRDRTGILGDIINSGPVYIGTPAFFYSFNNYASFRTANANRTAMVYVGANDGMLHGFDAVTGVERLAYVPSTIYGRLGRLTDTTYSHRYYVDGTPTVGDVYVGGSWRTMLVGSLRGGGQGIFALDVTDPTAFSESNAAQIVKWEYSDANDVDMGYSYSQPVIVRLADGRWAAVFGNGYNNTESDGRVSTTGAAVLYVVDMADGSLIRKISTGVGTAQDPTATSRPNGLATTAPVDVNGDAIVDYVYAGDLFGNLWRFDLSSTNSASWAVSNGGQALFVARSSGGSPQPQPITVRPVVSRHPTDANSYLVYFGTGKYIEQGDNATTGQVTQSFYAIWDRNLSGAGASTVLRSSLLQQQISSETPTAGGGKARITTANAIDWTTHRGWYMDLVNQQTGVNGGERQTTEAILRDGTVIFSTLLPNPEICGVGGGSWLMVLKAADGARLDESALDLNGDGVIDDNDKVIPGSSSSGTTTTACATSTSSTTTNSGRKKKRTTTTTTTTTTQCTTTSNSTGATVGTSTNICTTTTTNGVTSAPSCTTTTTGTSGTSGGSGGSGSGSTGSAVVGSGSYENSQMSAGQMLNNCNGQTCIANNQTDGDPETNRLNLPQGPQGRMTWQKLQ